MSLLGGCCAWVAAALSSLMVLARGVDESAQLLQACESLTTDGHCSVQVQLHFSFGAVV